MTENDERDDDLVIVDDAEDDGLTLANDDAGIYGLQAPLVVPGSEPARESAPVEGRGAKARSATPKDGAKDAKDVSKKDDADDELPPITRPFAERVFYPFKSLGFWIRTCATAGCVAIPLFIVMFLASRGITGEIRDAVEKNAEMSFFFALCNTLWRRRFAIAILSFIWSMISFAFLSQIFDDTVNGADEVDEWAEFNLKDAGALLLRVVCVATLAGAPGAALFHLCGIDAVSGFAFTSLLLTPIFCLSTIKTDSLFTLLTKETILSVKRCFRIWTTFMGIHLAFFAGSIILTLVALASVVGGLEEHAGWLRVFVVSVVAALTYAFVAALYARYFGRLAWVIEEDGRRREEEKAAEIKAAKSSEVDDYADVAIRDKVE